jgi:hypothetical protein
VEISSNHLNDVLDCGVETGNGVHGAEEEDAQHGEDTCDEEAPPWESRVGLVQANQAHNDGEDQGGNVPPLRHFFVREHKTVVRIEIWVARVAHGVELLGLFPELERILLGECFLEVAGAADFPGGFHIVVVPEHHVREGRGDGEVVGKEGDGVGCGEAGDTEGIDLGGIDLVIGVEEGGLVVLDEVGAVRGRVKQ